MGASNLGMIIPTLIGQNRMQLQADQMEEYRGIDQELARDNFIIQHPDADPSLKRAAIQNTLDLVEEHGPKEAADNLPQLGHVLTQIAAPSLIQGHFKRAQAAAQAQQKIRDRAGFTSPVPEGLKDPNMTFGDQSGAPPEAQPAPQPPDLSAAGLGPEASATPPAPDFRRRPGVETLPFAAGAQPSLRTLAEGPPSPAEQETRRQLSLAGPEAATTVPYTPPARPKQPPGPTPPPGAVPVLQQLAQTHLTRMQKFGRAMAAMGAGLQGRQWTSPENLLKAQIQQQQMMQAMQQQQIQQRWYVGQQYGLSGDQLRDYALSGQIREAAPGTSRLTEFILPDGSSLRLEYDPRTHKAYNVAGQEVQLPPGAQFAAPERGANTVYEQLKQAHRDLKSNDPGTVDAAKEFIAKEAKNNDVGAPPGYERGGASIANPNMNPGLEGDAIVYLVSGRMPAMGLSKGDYRQRVSQRAGEIRVNWGLEATDIVPLQTLTLADRQAFGRINIQDHAIGQLESTLAKNMDLAKRLSAAYQRGDIQLLNRIQNAFKTGKGDEEALNLAAQLHGVALEWAKIMEGGAMSAAGVRIGSAEAAEGIISDRMGNGQLTSLFDNVITKDANNRAEALAGEKVRIMNEMRNPAAVFGGGGMFGGGAGAGGTGPVGGQIPRVSTQQEYDALPDGARYMDADGVIGTKRKR